METGEERDGLMLDSVTSPPIMSSSCMMFVSWFVVFGLFSLIRY